MIINKIIFKGLFILLIIHFILITIYNAKNKNLATMKYQNVFSFSNDYVAPFFEQNWSMFAPNPPVSTIACLMKFKIIKENGRTLETKYLNIHKPVVLAGRSSIFSLDQRLLKYMHGCISDIISKKNTYLLAGNSSKQTDQNALPPYLQIHSPGYKSLKSYAKAVYRSSSFPYKIVESDRIFVKMKITDDHFPNFDNRNLDYKDIKNHKFYAMEIDYSELSK